MCHYWAVFFVPSLIQRHIFYLKYFHLTQHHSGVIPHVTDFAINLKVFKTVSGSEYVAVRYEASSAPTSPVGPRGFQEQESRPGELVRLGLLPPNREGLIEDFKS